MASGFLSPSVGPHESEHDLSARLSEEALANAPSGEMSLVDYGRQIPPPHEYEEHLRLDRAYLDVDSSSPDPIERMTGRVADFSVPTATSEFAGAIAIHNFALVDWRAVKGSVLRDAIAAEYAREGISWLFGKIEGAAILFRHIDNTDPSQPQTEDAVYAGSIGIKHPVNEIPVVTSPSKLNPGEHTYGFGLSAQDVARERDRMDARGEHRITYDKLRPGLELRMKMVREGASNVNRMGAKNSVINAYHLVPWDEDSVSYVWRALELSKHLQTTGNDKGLSISAIENTIMDTLAYTRLLISIQQLGGIAAKIGILDLDDPSQAGLVEQMVSDKFDLEDPEQKQAVQGALYVRYMRDSQGNINLPAPIKYGQPQGASHDIGFEKGFKLFSRRSEDGENASSPYRGFRTYQELLDEHIGNKTKIIKGTPRIPTTTMLHFATSGKGSSAKYGAHLSVYDPLEATGRVWEAFTELAPWADGHLVQGDPNNRENDITLLQILRGRYDGATAGTRAGILADSVYGLVRTSGDTRTNGIATGYRYITAIPPNQGVAMNVGHPNVSAQVATSGGTLQPVKRSGEEFKLPSVMGHKRGGNQTNLVPAVPIDKIRRKDRKPQPDRREPNLTFDRVDGFERTASVFVDGANWPYAYALSEADNGMGLPIPTVTVAKAGRVKT